MSTITYSSLANNSSTAFNPFTDVLVIDGSLDATRFDAFPMGNGLGMVFYERDASHVNTVKTINLLMTGTADPTNGYKLFSGNVTFANGSDRKAHV